MWRGRDFYGAEVWTLGTGFGFRASELLFFVASDHFKTNLPLNLTHASGVVPMC